MTSDGVDSVSLTRRTVLEAVAWIGAGAAVSAGLGTNAATAEEVAKPAPPAYRGTHTVEPLPFDPKKLKGLSEKLLVSHHDNN